ncbi:MAG TPA: sterol desaturase family protein [Chitinophagales bacterium]|nr:sterol desaturase family protein [Chitinophagales bacterium]
MNPTELLKEYFVGLGADVARYFIFAGIPFLLLYVLLKSKAVHYKIQQKFPESKHIQREISYSLLSMFIFGLFGTTVYVLAKHGYTKIYTDIHAHSMAYFFFSIVAFIVAHDTYFYWSHRLMHHKKIYPYVHLVHHKSHNPTPWATFAFHPTEAVMQVLILPIMVFAIPLHPLAIFAWSMYQLVLNVGGHTGYEIFRSGFTKRKHTFWSNTATHHNMHHKYVTCNYGLYFNVWDQLMGTNHQRYHEEFESIVERRKGAKA